MDQSWKVLKECDEDIIKSLPLMTVLKGSSSSAYTWIDEEKDENNAYYWDFSTHGTGYQDFSRFETYPEDRAICIK